MSRPDILTCALWLQERLGAYVFAVDHPGLPECAGAHRPDQPCDGQRGKHPCGRWSHDSTNDPDVIRAALSRGLRNLGIDCGKSGLLVVDEDVPKAFAEYAASIGMTVPETFAVDTAKGRHWYHQQPEGEPLGNSRGALSGRGIDIRGHGGFVVAPGSIHETGVIYTPVDASMPIAPAPAWLVSALQSVSQQAGYPQQAAGCRGSVYGRLRGVVATVLAAAPGERNTILYWSACRAAEMVAEGAVDEGAAVSALAQAGEAVGLGTSEVRATIASAMRGVMA